MRIAPFLAVAALVWVHASRAQEGQAPVQRLSTLHYELDVVLNYDDETLAGSSRIRLQNHSDAPADEISLVLYRLMNVREVRVRGRAVPFTQRVRSYDDFAKLQVNHIRIPLEDALPPGDSLTVDVDYSGHLLGYAETGMRYIQDRISPAFTILRDDARAFPQPGYPSVAANRSAPMPSYDYLARITVPDTLTVANGGELIEVLREGDRATFTYRSLMPSWRMDFAIAAYGLIEMSPLRIFYLPGDSVGARSVTLAAAAAFERFAAWFGPLSNPSALSVIEIPDGWGSQTDVTAIIQAAAAFRDSTRHRELFHEISHMWNVTPTDLPSPRWNEGLASFLEYRMSETLSGIPEVDDRMVFLIQWLRGKLASNQEWSEVPMIRYGERGMTDLSYTVGALFFDQLYRRLGPASFNMIVGEFYRRHVESGGSTADFVQLVRETVGDRADAIIEDWIYSTEWTRLVEGLDSADEISSYYDRSAGE